MVREGENVRTGGNRKGVSGDKIMEDDGSGRQKVDGTERKTEEVEESK